MDNQVVRMGNQGLEKSTVNNSTRHLLLSIHNQNKLEINNNIEQYREGGVIRYDKLLGIPLKDRMVGLVNQYGKEKIHGLLILMLTDFCNFYNVIRPMSATQIVDCAFELINTSIEDYLGIEDFTIFFQGAKNGKYGKIYDRLDQQLIFEMLEVYRQDRHEKYLSVKEEKESNYKATGDNFRICDDASLLKDLFHQSNLEYFKSKLNEHSK